GLGAQRLGHFLCPRQAHRRDVGRLALLRVLARGLAQGGSAAVVVEHVRSEPRRAASRPFPLPAAGPSPRRRSTCPASSPCPRSCPGWQCCRRSRARRRSPGTRARSLLRICPAFVFPSPPLSRRN